MGWSSPRTYTVGEIITKSILDTHVKDNLRYLKGLDGVPTIQAGLIIASLLGTEYLQIPSLTTTERTNLTPANGMIIYNETTTEFNKYEAGAWVDLADNTDHGGLDGLGDDDHTQYILHTLTTTRGDVITRGASANQRLALGTNGQYLTSDGTDVSWGAAPTGGLGIYGDGSDGNVTISSDTSLSRDMLYNNLTVDNGFTLTTNGYRIFVLATLTNNGTISGQGTNGANGSQGGVTANGGAALASGSLGASAAGGNGKGASGAYPCGGGGGGGGRVTLICAKEVVNNGTITANGGGGGNGATGNDTGGSAASGGAAGTVTAPTAAQGSFRALPQAILLHIPSGTFIDAGAGGGGGAGGNAAGEGGGSKSSNSLGANGAVGGNAVNTTSAGGGGGGGGGYLVIVYTTGTTWTTETANGGTGGIGAGAGQNGTNGSNGTTIKLAHS